MNTDRKLILVTRHTRLHELKQKYGTLGQAKFYIEHLGESFEQYAVRKETVGDAVYWMQEEGICDLTLFNGQPISVLPPNFVEMQIVETDPGLRGDTSGSGGKPALLDSGATVRVPLFVQEGEVIKIDTRTGEYVSRVKG